MNFLLVRLLKGMRADNSSTVYSDTTLCYSAASFNSMPSDKCCAFKGTLQI